VTTTAADANAENDEASATTTVTDEADLSVGIVDDPDPVFTGTSLTYTIMVANAGVATAASVVATVTLPAGTTLLNAAGGWSCATEEQVVTCAGGGIDPGVGVLLVLSVAAPRRPARSRPPSASPTRRPIRPRQQRRQRHDDGGHGADQRRPLDRLAAAPEPVTAAAP